MSATLSSTVSSTAPSSSPSSCATADFTRFPTNDIACAVGSVTGIPSNTSSVLSKCCKTAPVDTFNGACGYYCISVQQSVADLTKCIQEGGINPSLIFCNGNNTASASGTPRSMASPTRSGASGTGPSSAASTGAADVNKAGLGLLGMLGLSVIAGLVL